VAGRGAVGFKICFISPDRYLLEAVLALNGFLPLKLQEEPRCSIFSLGLQSLLSILKILSLEFKSWKLKFAQSSNSRFLEALYINQQEMARASHDRTRQHGVDHFGGIMAGPVLGPCPHH
jgi:hypothetical protein